MIKRGIFILFLLGSAASLFTAGCKSSLSAEEPGGKAVYQCPMHPQVVSDKPGKCPICGMDLQKVDAEHGGEADGAESAVPGHASFSLSPERQQLIGVTTTKVKRRDLNVEVRAVGKVAYDPELYNAVAEYREAVSAKNKIKDSPLPEAHERAEALIKSCVLKLRLMGLSGEQVQKMAKEGADPVNLLLPGKTAWVYVQVYEYEVELVHPGQKVMVTVPSMRGQEYRGRVIALDPVLNTATRTIRVRAEISTPNEKLRPEMFLNVTILAPLGERLAVPEDSVLNTGENHIVFITKGRGEFEPRSIKIGQEAQGFYVVLSGLSDGDDVVTSANFLIDSESRLRAALAGFSAKPATSSAR